MFWLFDEQLVFLVTRSIISDDDPVTYISKSSVTLMILKKCTEYGSQLCIHLLFCEQLVPINNIFQ